MCVGGGFNNTVNIGVGNFKNTANTGINNHKYDRLQYLLYTEAYDQRRSKTCTYLFLADPTCAAPFDASNVLINVKSTVIHLKYLLLSI